MQELVPNKPYDMDKMVGKKRKFDCFNCGRTSGVDNECSYCVMDNNINSKPSEWTPKIIESVNHPNHYQTKTGLETIDVIEAFTSDLTGIEAFDTANVIKYICRWKKKNGLEDLKKAKWYLEHLSKYVENQNKGEK